MEISNKLRKLVDPNSKCCCEHNLGNKCKEWAKSRGFIIETKAYDYMEDGSYSGTYWHIHYLKPKDFYEKCGCPNCGANSTEPEAIFKACQWILENQNEKN